MQKDKENKMKQETFQQHLCVLMFLFRDPCCGKFSLKLAVILINIYLQILISQSMEIFFFISILLQEINDNCTDRKSTRNTKNSVAKKSFLTLEYSQVLFKINGLILEQIMSDRRGSMHMEGQNATLDISIKQVQCPAKQV